MVLFVCFDWMLVACLVGFCVMWALLVDLILLVWVELLACYGCLV